MAEETKSAAMPTDLKFKNRVKILDVFRESKQRSINDIAEVTGISRQTIVKSIGFFLEKGIIVSLGKGKSTEIGGKRPELYIFNEKYRYFLYVIISEANVVAGIMDLLGKSFDNKCFDVTKDESIEYIAENVGDCFKTIIAENEIDETKIYSLGICMGGIYDKNTGVMKYNSIFPHWGEDIPIYDIFKKYIPENCRIYIDNEAKAAGKAEIVKDRSLTEKRVVTIYSADGISAALIENGHIAYGKNSLIGEIGHLCLAIDNGIGCECGLKGCFEHIVSDEKLYEIYGKKVKNINEIFRSAENNDESSINARKAILFAGEYFGAAIRNIILLTDPDVIILQGKFAGAGSHFADIIKDKIQEFKYFGKSKGLDLRLDTSDTTELKTVGLAQMLAEDLFADEDVYR